MEICCLITLIIIKNYTKYDKTAPARKLIKAWELKYHQKILF